MALSDQERHDRWMFGSHSRAELGSWAKRLRLFRFRRAIGGHANDGDTLACELRFEDETDLLAVCDALGAPLQSLPPGEPQPEKGRSYSFEEMSRFRNGIAHFPHWQTPGWRTLAGVKVFLWVGDGRISLTLSGAEGNPYEVTEKDVENAERVESVLAGLSSRAVESTSDLCINPATYPAFFSSPTSQ